MAEQIDDRSGADNLWPLSNQRVKSPDSESPKKSREQALNRACEACRISKVRCLVNPDAGSTQCQRCAKAGKPCVFAPPTKRRQRKRTDVRVTELEKEIQQMRSLLKSNNPQSQDSDQDSTDEHSDDQVHGKGQDASTDPQSYPSTMTAMSPLNHWPSVTVTKAQEPDTTHKCGYKESHGASENDIMDRGVISWEMANELLSIWRNELVRACPGVTLSSQLKLAELREKKPLLFHAIMAAAAHSKGSELSNKLHEEAISLYAQSMFIKGEKSVQAIQALLVTVAYNSPPKTPGQLQVYQWVNMAASMALELGLASRPRTHEQLPKRAIRSLQKISSPEELLEHCRTVLLLYTISAGFSMRLKRPNILLFNSWMEECFNMLDKSKSLDDKRIIAYLKLQRIADEANTAFGFDDASTSFTLSELRMQMILRIFDRRMQDWWKSVPDEVMTIYATIEFHQNMLSMWEFGMDGGHYDVTEYRNRQFTLPALDDDTNSIQPESLLSRSALQINATTKCISAAQSILECVIAIPTEKLQKAPNVVFVRAVYALVALMKADYAVGTDADMGELLESQSLKVEFYLETVLQHAHDAVGPNKCRIPSHWAFVLEKKLKSWWNEYQEWRKTGSGSGGVKRRKTVHGVNNNTASGDATPLFAEARLPERSATHPLPSSSDHSTAAPFQVPNYNLGTTTTTTYTPWSGTDILDTSPTTTTTTQQTIPEAATFNPDIGDFSAVFQTGDLYLWDGMNVDSFGGWGSQSGLYGGMGFGGLNGQGF